MTNICLTPSMGDAHVRVALVSSPKEADLLVCKVAAMGLATRPGLWFITNKEQATVYVCLCSRGMAPLSVCMVTPEMEAGWVTSDSRLRRLVR